ncbi:Alpha-mannosidase i mns4 [Thalictrum thalictroides]|uniref:alpha-1,2-Mannosidase n=1 Tax=Thalictrum thalictroides TaxID=46969 RepID=A0A7J6X7N0_THATH|nr:Alpha-mannosidase i mns4 [Thalictrum thalictroides]
MAGSSSKEGGEEDDKVAKVKRVKWSMAKGTKESVGREEAKQLRDEVRDMFYHAFGGYMEHAFPLDELRPLTCAGEDSLGGYALTLIDSLDTLALFGDREQFAFAVEWIGKNLRFDINKTVSVFETTIRVLGGLLSAHLIASDHATGMRIASYNDELLTLSEDLARRLLPAFDTPTGIPFGSVNLLHGVDETESKITSTAGGGTLTLEFGVLSRLTNDPVFEQATKNAVRGIWARRSKINLVGAHINVFTGEWTQKDAGIGTSIDSFYEYLLKAHLLFGDEEYLFMFQEAYKAAMHYLFNDPWYVEVNMNSAVIVWPLFNSLQAFWPGLQVLAGDIDPAIRTHHAFFSVWKKYGFTPEGFNLATFTVQQGQKSYPLRPELMESTYWLYKATGDSRYLDAGRDMIASLQYGARCPCGYCHISDVESHKQEDHMESFFLAETETFLNVFRLKVLAGDIDPAIRTHHAFFSVWKKYGFTPEGFNLATFTVQQGQKSYPLRPELMESTYWLYKATGDSRYLDAGRDMIASLQYGARCPCGYCHISDVESHKQEDHMESFFLAETVKYLWLLFDLAVGPDNLVENGPYKYIFSTEGHLLPATPEIALVHEQCSYFGSFCRGNYARHRSVFNISDDTQGNNDSRLRTSGGLSNTPFKPTSHRSTSGLIKGVCRGLNHAQKYGISYMPEADRREDEPAKQQEATKVQTHSVVHVSNTDLNSMSNEIKDGHTTKKSIQKDAES